MRLWILLCVVSREIAQRQVSSRKFAKESIMRSRASDARKSLKQLVSANITNVHKSLVLCDRGFLLKALLYETSGNKKTENPHIILDL